MKYAYLGRSGLRVSRLCLGTMNFGPNTDEKESFAIMDRALDAGINYFDTANMYGARNGGYPGWTEDIIGRWFAQGGGRREKTVLATKVYASMNDENDGPNDVDGLSAYKIHRNLEGCMRRLQTDHIEIYQMHHYDRRANWTELWGAFETLVNQGKIRYVASSNFAGHHLTRAQLLADQRGFLGLVSEQHRYNLICRMPELEVLPAAKELGIGVVCFSPLGMGLLSGSLFRPIEQGQRSTKYENKVGEEMMAKLAAYHKLCEELGESEANVALAWILANPAVTAPIIGPRTVAQLEDSLRAVEISMDDSVMKRLDEIFPGPGGEGPEAYSWG